MGSQEIRQIKRTRDADLEIARSSGDHSEYKGFFAKKAREANHQLVETLRGLGLYKAKSN